MTDTNTLAPCPHLEPCPWCGCALHKIWRKTNPRASCKTEGCFGLKMSVVNLDDPGEVASWNRRSRTGAAAMSADSTVEPIDALGPMASLKWDESADGTYFVQITVSGLRSEKQAQAAAAHMQRLFCGQEQEPSQ